MKTKLLRRIRRKVNYQYFQRGNEVLMSIYATDIDPSFVVIYDCMDEDQAQRICERERTKMMRDTLSRMKWKRDSKKYAKEVKRLRNERISNEANKNKQQYGADRTNS